MSHDPGFLRHAAVLVQCAAAETAGSAESDGGGEQDTSIAHEGLLVVSVPHDPDLQVAFGLMIAGIMYSTRSRNVRVKRVVLPMILASFSFVFLESIRRTIDPPVVVLVVLAAILMWNGAAAMRQVRYCARCGRTLRDRSRRKLCAECRASSTPPA